MALTEEQINEIRTELETSFRPLFFFDDDPDGLCSFLLLYRKIREGKGIVVKSSPELDEKFLKQVHEYQPDKIFILDKPMVKQEFIDGAKIKIVWIDHHEPVNMKNVKYYNPRVNDDKDNRPTSYWCYKIADDDLWIAMVGILGDWFLPVFSQEFTKLYPRLLPEDIKKPEKALFETEMGKLVRIFSFILKGKTQDVLKYIKILTRIDNPEEILMQTTSQGKFIYKKYEKTNKQYEEILKDVKVTEDKIILYIYKDDKMSFTADLSNELLYKYPDRIIIVGREKSGEVKCSLRSTNIKLPIIIKNALKDVEGYGGGHEFASGACIKKKDFEQFIDNIRKQIK